MRVGSNDLRIFFLKSSEPTLNKSHVLHAVLSFFPTASHLVQQSPRRPLPPPLMAMTNSHLDVSNDPQTATTSPLSLHTNTWGRREWWQGYGDGWGVATRRQARDMGHGRGSRRVSSRDNSSHSFNNDKGDNGNDNGNENGMGNSNGKVRLIFNF